MAHGKTTEMFLVEGTADGLVTAELSNWNGKAIRIPRTEVDACQRDDIQGVGVYLLFCKDDNGADSVYIGEAENILKRLRQHLTDYKNDKEQYYWSTAVCFVGTDLNKALIRYLEWRLVDKTKKCGRYAVLTKATYGSTVLKESQVASMEEFLDNIAVLLNALGYRVLVPVKKSSSKTKVLNCIGNKAQAKGFVSPAGFTVMSGSTVSDHLADHFTPDDHRYSALRSVSREPKKRESRRPAPSQRHLLSQVQALRQCRIPDKADRQPLHEREARAVPHVQGNDDGMPWQVRDIRHVRQGQKTHVRA